MGDDLLTAGLELAGDRGPRAALLDEEPWRTPDRGAPRRIAQQRDDGRGEVARLVGRQEMCARDHGESLGTDGRGDDGLPHGARLEDLEARAAPDAERDDVDGAARHPGA